MASEISREDDYLVCSWPDCSYRTIHMCNLTLHVNTKHEDTRKTVDCTWENCTYQTKKPTHMKRHMMKHSGVIEKTLPCTWRGCMYKASERYTINQHLLKHTAGISSPPEDGDEIVESDGSDGVNVKSRADLFH